MSVKYACSAVIAIGIALLQMASSGATGAIKGDPSWPVSSEPAQRLVLPGVPQFGKVNEQVWRSGQPTAMGYKRLAKMGLKTVINLRNGSPTDRKILPKGVRYFAVPVPDLHAPTDAKVLKVIHVVSNPDNWPVLIHCESGEGRTAVMCAALRYSMDGWDKQKILDEVRNFRVTHFGVMKTPLGGSERHFIDQWMLKNTRGACLSEVHRPEVKSGIGEIHPEAPARQSGAVGAH